MTQLIARLRSIPAVVRVQTGRAIAAPAARRRRRADVRARAICPVDSWTFTPLYSDGRCPLCGWKPDGYVYTPPPLTPYERYWGALGGIVATSVAMCIVVVLAYTHA
jgi:hypothetical protein